MTEHDPLDIAPFLEPVRKTVRVQCAPAHAFRVFTERFGAWWPLPTHSIGQERAVGCTIEPRVGGSVYEERDDGVRFEWGRVLEWEPPHRFVMTWHPGMEPAEAGQVEMRFVADGDATIVELEHRGWEALGAKASEVRTGYDHGWESVFVVHFANAFAAVPSR